MKDPEHPIFPAGSRGTTPPPGEQVMVITDKIRCPGYTDFDGAWHRQSDGAQLKHVLGWSPIKWLANDSCADSAAFAPLTLMN